MPTWGRGGAGNIVSDEQVREQERRLAEDRDIEANVASNTTSPAANHSQPQSEAQEYAHMGRGGAGNWYQPSELEKEGTFSKPSDSTAAPTTNSRPNVSTPWHPESQELPIARAGRGGAGNMVWKDEEKERMRREEEERARAQLGEKVEKDVEAALPKPPGAVLGRQKPGRGW